MGRVHEWEPAEREDEERPVPPAPVAPAGEAMSVPAVLALQRSIGNRAVSGILMRGRQQPRGKKDRPFRKAKAKSMYSGVKKYKSERLTKLHGGGRRDTGPRVPVVTADGQRLWDGRRPSFRQQTYTNVLEGKGEPRTRNNRRTYKCATCGRWFPRLGDAVGDETTIDLDHVRDWDTHVTMTVDMTEFTDADGHRWRAYLRSEVTDAYNDEDNLVPKCSFHNRSKGGPKFIDRFQRPEHVANCPGCRAEELGDIDDEEDDDSDEMDEGGGMGGGGVGVAAY